MRAVVALLADYPEEGWPSMDLVAGMLASHLPDPLDGAGMELQLIRPTMRRRFSRWLSVKQGRIQRAAWSLDRLSNRFHDYPRLLRGLRGRFDLFHLVDHSYSQLLHELPPGRSVVTCHDLDTFRCLWEPQRAGRGWAFVAMTRRILAGMQKAAHVCCDSEATRGELLSRGLIPAERVSVVRLGVRPEFVSAPDSSVETAVEKMLATQPRSETADLLHVGSTIARKRIDLLLEVFARVKRRVPHARLLRVGGELTAEQFARVERLKLRDSILTLPFLSPAELAAVYRRAALTLLPSDSEGFGLPIIESLACGTPTVVSDLPVLREVGGEAALYVSVGDTEAWAFQVSELLRERGENPIAWEARRARCRRQAAKFSWAETAQQMATIYQRVLAAA